MYKCPPHERTRANKGRTERTERTVHAAIAANLEAEGNPALIKPRRKRDVDVMSE
jgi:hypothetical protein